MSMDSFKEGLIPLKGIPGWPDSVHEFDARQSRALASAVAIGRPLLVRGEPGTGKSQLAYAAAAQTGRALLNMTVDARTEASDLLWRVDSVARLADAQVQRQRPESIRVSRYVQPGLLWWAYNWQQARARQLTLAISARTDVPEVPADWSPERGTVVLIDEIDKADSDVPNGLLEALGNRSFHVPALQQKVTLAEAVPAPLVIITSNDERELPAAFLRRCLVLTLKLGTGDEMREFLVRRGRQHFPADKCPRLHEEFEIDSLRGDAFVHAAEMLIKDREHAKKQGLYPPGPAEYLDLLRIVAATGEPARASLEMLKGFVYVKQSDQ